jgi:hypothetical protein
MQRACAILSLSLLWLSNIFPHLINGTIKKKIGGVLLENKMFSSSLQLLSETFLNVHWTWCKVQCTLSGFSETWTLWTDFRKKKLSSNIKCHETPSSGSRVVPWGRTDGRWDRHDEANSRSSQFCKCVYNTEATRSMKIIYCSNDTAPHKLSDVEAADTRM